jgi:hypothetical protein
VNLSKAKTPHEQEVTPRQIAATDQQIGALVYELYGLTGQEIRIVEEPSPDARGAKPKEKDCFD